MTIYPRLAFAAALMGSLALPALAQGNAPGNVPAGAAGVSTAPASTAAAPTHATPARTQHVVKPVTGAASAAVHRTAATVHPSKPTTVQPAVPTSGNAASPPAGTQTGAPRAN